MLIAILTVLAWSGFVCSLGSLAAYYITRANGTRLERILMDRAPFRPWLMPTLFTSTVFLIAKYFVA